MTSGECGRLPWEGVRLLYRPPKLTLWDTLLYNDEGTYHLFFLQENGLGHAVSADLSTWIAAKDVDTGLTIE
jgi:hypothetical protein